MGLVEEVLVLLKKLFGLEQGNSKPASVPVKKDVVNVAVSPAKNFTTVKDVSKAITAPEEKRAQYSFEKIMELIYDSLMLSDSGLTRLNPVDKYHSAILAVHGAAWASEGFKKELKKLSREEGIENLTLALKDEIEATEKVLKFIEQDPFMAFRNLVNADPKYLQGFLQRNTPFDYSDDITTEDLKAFLRKLAYE